MKVLFICSGNSNKGISSIIYSQGDSLREAGLDIEYFLIRRKGFWGYLTDSFRLKKKLKEKNFDIVHAHYLFSGLSDAVIKSDPLHGPYRGNHHGGRKYRRQRPATVRREQMNVCPRLRHVRWRQRVFRFSPNRLTVRNGVQLPAEIDQRNDGAIVGNG